MAGNAYRHIISTFRKPNEFLMGSAGSLMGCRSDNFLPYNLQKCPSFLLRTRSQPPAVKRGGGGRSSGQGGVRPVGSSRGAAGAQLSILFCFFASEHFSISPPFGIFALFLAFYCSHFIFLRCRFLHFSFASSHLHKLFYIWALLHLLSLFFKIIFTLCVPALCFASGLGHFSLH